MVIIFALLLGAAVAVIFGGVLWHIFKADVAPTSIVSAKQKSVSLPQEEKPVRMNSEYAELNEVENANEKEVEMISDHSHHIEPGAAENAKQENVEMSEDDQEIIFSEIDNEVIEHKDSEEMYYVQEGENLTNGGTAGNETRKVMMNMQALRACSKTKLLIQKNIWIIPNK